MTVPEEGPVVKLGNAEGEPGVGEAYEPTKQTLSVPLTRKKLCFALLFVVKVLLP